MEALFITMGLAFIEGLALIISPCILPILPIILSGSLVGNKSRPFGIIIGFIITFTLITLFSRWIINLTHLPPDTIRNASFIILIFLGIIMMSTYLTDKFTLYTQQLTTVGTSLKTANNSQSGLLGGILFGGLIGIIWTPCAGPILAAVIVQVVIQMTTFASILIVLAFAIGAGLPMLLVALLGRKILQNIKFIRDNTMLIRKLLGFIIIASVVFLFFNPELGVSAPTNQSTSTNSLINGLSIPYPAPEIAGIDAWINSPPLILNELKNKVVLIDFWTYSCINCIRTLPYIKDWYAKYHDNGLVIIGVHSPEFQFEQDVNNVKNAVKKFGILYPVALDNQFVTWRNFNNKYWPAHYLINKNGQVVYEHFGEGEYDATENNIRFLLGLQSDISSQPEEINYANTPETYLGYARAEHYASPETVINNKSISYTYPSSLSLNQWALKGDWIVHADKIVAAKPGAAVKIHFSAKNVFVVMGTTGLAVTANVRLNGELLIADKGTDVDESAVKVAQNQLYSVVSLKRPGEGILEIIANTAGLEIYTFTFG